MKKNKKNNCFDTNFIETTQQFDVNNWNTNIQFSEESFNNQAKSTRQAGCVGFLINNIYKVQIAFFTVIMLFLSIELNAQNACQTQLFNIGYNYGTRGFSCSFEKYGTLNDSYYRNHQVYLRAGNYYEICAVCDNDCEDLDIKLYDGFGNLIAEDESTDDFPMVFCNVISSGYFTIKVIMADCSNEPCGYGVAAFVK